MDFHAEVNKLSFPVILVRKNCWKWVVGEESFEAKSLQPAKFLKYLGKMVNFIQKFCLLGIIATMQAIKCSLAKIK